jgi:hypothetical protein
MRSGTAGSASSAPNWTDPTSAPRLVGLACGDPLGGLRDCAPLLVTLPLAGYSVDQMSQEERIAHNIAHNEDWCRDLNKRKAEWMKSGHPTAGFRCECWRMDCGDRFPLSGREWQEVRSRQNRFAVAPGHIAVNAKEVVVKEYGRFWIIEKRGEAGEVSESLE